MSDRTVRVPIDSSSSEDEKNREPVVSGTGSVPPAGELLPSTVLPSGAPPKAVSKPSGAASPSAFVKSSSKAKTKAPHRKKKTTVVRSPSRKDDRFRDSRRNRDSHRNREDSHYRSREREGRRRSRTRSRRRLDQRVTQILQRKICYHFNGPPSTPHTPRPLLRRVSNGMQLPIPPPVPMELDGAAIFTPRAELLSADERFRINSLTGEINSAIAMRQDFVGSTDREIKKAAQILSTNGILSLHDLRLTPKRNRD